MCSTTRRYDPAALASLLRERRRREERGKRIELEVRQSESVGIVAAINKECFLDLSLERSLKLYSKLVRGMF